MSDWVGNPNSWGFFHVNAQKIFTILKFPFAYYLLFAEIIDSSPCGQVVKSPDFIYELSRSIISPLCPVWVQTQ